MTSIKLLVLVCTFLCINAATNLVSNPGFDDTKPDCFSPPSWSQYNASNKFTTCPEQSYYVTSPPSSLYMSGLSGYAGAVQTITLNQQAATTFNFSCMYWLVSCSQQSCYTTIGWLGVVFGITYTDGTTDTFESAFPHGYSTAVFVPYNFQFTPAKPVATLVLRLLMDGNGMATSMWDDISLTATASSTPATEAPTSAPTIAPTSPTIAPTSAPTNPTTAPTSAPSNPTTAPTSAPSNPTDAPATSAPTNPTTAPTNPTSAPSNPTSAPTNPTTAPTNPTPTPTTSVTPNTPIYLF